MPRAVVYSLSIHALIALAIFSHPGRPGLGLYGWEDAALARFAGGPPAPARMWHEPTPAPPASAPSVLPSLPSLPRAAKPSTGGRVYWHGPDPWGFPPRIRKGEAVICGGGCLGKIEIGRVMTKSASKFRRCYERALKSEGPDVAGRLVLHFAIAQPGFVNWGHGEGRGPRVAGSRRLRGHRPPLTPLSAQRGLPGFAGGALPADIPPGGLREAPGARWRIMSVGGPYG